jgi:predicted homoserine dehydrogenase-like protein
MSRQSVTRRDFVKQASATMGAGAVISATSYGKILGANDRVRLGIIGPGARGREVMNAFIKVPNAEFVAAAEEDRAGDKGVQRSSKDDRTERC